MGQLYNKRHGQNNHDCIHLLLMFNIPHTTYTGNQHQVYSYKYFIKWTGSDCYSTHEISTSLLHASMSLYTSVITIHSFKKLKTLVKKCMYMCVMYLENISSLLSLLLKFNWVRTVNIDKGTYYLYVIYSHVIYSFMGFFFPKLSNAKFVFNQHLHLKTGLGLGEDSPSKD